ncbi:MAG: DUF502 domain-containing protein [Planctomycetes bacterium]|nr:DUF502 domain-containing protein [Planctomycetota bacterium]
MDTVPQIPIPDPPESAIEALPGPAAKRTRIQATVRAVLRARITAGLVVVLPLWVTFLLIKFVFEMMRDMSMWAVTAYLTSNWGDKLLAGVGVTPQQVADGGIAVLPRQFRWGVGVFSVLLTIFVLYVIGLMTANIVGRRLVKLLERILDRLPIIKTIYGASKQILETFAGESAQSFQRVALVPFPSSECRSIGFITGFTKDTNTGEELCTVFVATTPTTTGYVFVVRRSDIIELTWSIEDALRLMISGGVILPSEIPFALAPRKTPLTSIAPPREKSPPQHAKLP